MGLEKFGAGKDWTLEILEPSHGRTYALCGDLSEVQVQIVLVTA
jgi:hypothetical protein